jgi:RNA polymerase sigma factor (sigma-70 family)
MLRGRTVRKTAADMARASGARPTLEDIAAASGLSSGTAAARAILLADDARALMAEFNLRLVFNMARRAHHINQASIELSDLVSEGTQGMYKAIDRWDPSRKLRFSTYGHWWIRQSISRFISRHIRDVRLPVHIHDLGVKIHRIAGEIEDDPEQSTLDSHKLVADALGLSVERVVAIARHTRIPKTPLDTSASDNSLRTPKDISQNGFALDAWGNDDTDDPAPNPVLEAEREEHLRAITTVLLCSLPVRERNILQLRYGINPMSSVDTGEDSDESEEWEQRTSSNGIVGSKGSDDGRDGVAAASEREVSPSALRSVGSTYKLSKERIRQLEAEALRRLRSSWRLRLVQLLQSGQPLTQETMQALFEARSAQDGSSALRVLSSVGVTDDVVYLRGMSGGEQRIG